MPTNKSLTYVVGALVVAGVALAASVPAYFLLVLACPVMMLFMMSSTSGGHSRDEADASAASETSTRTSSPGSPDDRV